jgi:hypothetical protein
MKVTRYLKKMFEGEGYENTELTQNEIQRRLDAAGIGWHIADGILFAGNPLTESDHEMQETTNWKLFDLLAYIE